MAKLARALGAIYLDGAKEPIAPGTVFRHKESGWLINEGAAEPYTGSVDKDVVWTGSAQADPFDPDGDGKPGGRLPDDPPSLSGKNKAELLAIASDEGVEADESMTNAAITEAIEAAREAASDDDAPAE